MPVPIRRNSKNSRGEQGRTDFAAGVVVNDGVIRVVAESRTVTPRSEDLFAGSTDHNRRTRGRYREFIQNKAAIDRVRNTRGTPGPRHLSIAALDLPACPRASSPQ